MPGPYQALLNVLALVHHLARATRERVARDIEHTVQRMPSTGVRVVARELRTMEGDMPLVFGIFSLVRLCELLLIQQLVGSIDQRVYLTQCSNARKELGPARACA